MNGGEGCAQLVAGVGDELAHLLRHGLLLMETPLDLREHAVERSCQRAYLRGFTAFRHTLGKIAGGNLRGGLLYSFERAQGSLHHQCTQGTAK